MSNFNNFREILLSKEEELRHWMRNRDAITIEKSADALDEVQHASERELAIRNLDRDSKLLRKVRAALRAMDDDSFGTCLRCEKEISSKRLAAVPWALLCIHCQEHADRKQLDGGEMVEEMLGTAA